MQYWMGTENNACDSANFPVLVWESASHEIARYLYIYIATADLLERQHHSSDLHGH